MLRLHCLSNKFLQSRSSFSARWTPTALCQASHTLGAKDTSEEWAAFGSQQEEGNEDTLVMQFAL